MSPIGRFLLWMLAFDFFGFAIGGVIAGGDPTAEPYVVGTVLVLAPAAAHLVVYQGGENWIRAALGLPAAADGSDKNGAEEGEDAPVDTNDAAPDPGAVDADPDPGAVDADPDPGAVDADDPEGREPQP